MSDPRRGTALPAALVVLAVTTALTAALAEIAHDELLLARLRLGTAMALAAADLCLARATAGLRAGWDYAGVPPIPEDREVPIPPGCSLTAAALAGSTDTDRFLLTVDAHQAGGHRRLKAVIGHAAPPGAPALVWLVDGQSLAPVGGGIVLGGTSPATPLGVAALAAPGDPGILDRWLAAQGTRVRVTVGAPLDLPPPPLAELAARAQARAQGGATSLVTAGTPPTQLTWVEGDLVIDGARRGAGLLVVDGAIDVRGVLDFAGVLVATRGLRVDAGGSLTVEGALWLGGPAGGNALEVEGSLTVLPDPPAVATADGLLPLPRLPAILGLQDLG